jgi:hypothetical protein
VSKRGLREVERIEQVSFGRGHTQRYLLSCGHTVEHIGRHDLHVGSMTHCEEC